MKPKPLVAALVLVGVLVAGAVLLLVPEDESGPRPGSPAAQPDATDGLPSFQAGRAIDAPAEPLVAAGTPGRPAVERSDAARDADAGAPRRTIRGVVLRASDGSPLPGAAVVASEGAAAAGGGEGDGTALSAIERWNRLRSSHATDAGGRFAIEALPEETVITVTSEDPWPLRLQRYEIEAGQGDISDLQLRFDSGFIVSGLVLDESGGRLAGALVDVDGRAAKPAEDDGSFRILDVAPQPGVASVQVSARAPGHARAGRDALVPGDPSAPVVVELRLPPGGAIAGRITDAHGEPLAGARASVAFVMTASHGEVAPRDLSGTSDAHGDYLIDSVPEGRYLVEASAGLSPEVRDQLEALGYLSSGEVHPASAASGRASGGASLGRRWFPGIDVRVGQTTRLDIQLFAPASLSGRVLEANGAAVAGAEVTLERVERWPSSAVNGSMITSSDGLLITSEGSGGQGQTELARREGQVATDAGGGFAFTGLTDGELRLGVAAGGLVSQSRSLRLQPAEQRTGEDFVLERGLPVRGRVREASGAPIQGAHVEVRALDAKSFVGGQRLSDAEGRFVVDGLPAGPKQLIVFMPGFASRQQTVEPGGAELDLVLDPAPKVIGYVTHAVTGAPITRFDVTLSSGGSTWVNTGSDYPEGRFEMPVDENSPCTISVRAGGFREAVIENVVPSRTVLEPLRVHLMPQ